MSSRRARLTVMRLTPVSRTSSLSEGTRWPGGHSPLAMAALIRFFTRTYSGAVAPPLAGATL